MKTSSGSRAYRLLRLVVLAFTLGIYVAPAAHAGLTMEVDLTRGNYQGSQYYQFGSTLNTNGTPPNVSFGDYFVVSPGWPTNVNASATLFHFDASGFNQVSSAGSGGFSLFDAPDFSDSFIQNITNGLWSIYVTNTITTNVYYFAVTASIGSNSIPLVSVIYPPNNALNVTNQPTFVWQSPTNYSEQILYANGEHDLPVTQQSFSAATLDAGLNSIYLDTYYLSSTGVVSSVPTNNAGSSLSGWVSTWHVWDYANVQFTVGSPSADFNSDLNTTDLPWATMGDAAWFTETTNTYNGAPAAAQSGSVTGDQASTLSVTVNGPGTLTFYWSSIANDGNQGFSCEFDVDGNYSNNITGDTDWYQDGPYTIGPGQHTLSWTAYANGDTDPTEAGFLDNVNFTVTRPPPPTGNWTITGAIQTSERFAFPLTVLTNGQVLASGGQAVFSSTTYFESDLYNPASGTWQTTTGYLNNARQYHTTTLLTNGLVLAAGGVTVGAGGQTVSACELYSPATGLWTTTGSMKTARYSHTAVLLTNGVLLVAGGISNSVTLASSELYNPATGTWTSTGDLNTPRSSAAAFLLNNGTVLVVGGQGTGSTTLSRAEIYNPGTGLWHYTASPMLASHYQPISNLLPDGRVLVAGGSTNGTSVTGFSELYDPASDSWSQTGSMNTPRASAGSVLLNNGIVLVAGGSNGNSLTNAELYDPGTGIWTVTGAMKEGRNGPFPMVLLASGQALATGGLPANNDLSTGTAELYTTTVPTIRILNPTRLAGGVFQFSFTNTPGAGSTVFGTTNLGLSLANWTTLGSATEVSPGQFQFTDPQATNISKRFYRVSSP